MTLRFNGVCVLIHVNCQNHSHKTRIMTNPNSYGLNSILISCHLAAQGPAIASKLFVQHFENSKNSYAKPTLTGMGTEYVNTIGYKPQVVC